LLELEKLRNEFEIGRKFGIIARFLCLEITQGMINTAAFLVPDLTHQLRQRFCVSLCVGDEVFAAERQLMGQYALAAEEALIFLVDVSDGLVDVKFASQSFFRDLRFCVNQQPLVRFAKFEELLAAQALNSVRRIQELVAFGDIAA
jgi:hypothetical protein